MNNQQKGFTLIELVAVIILLGIISVTLFSRLGPIGTSAVQSSRDDFLAALFFAQQQAMMRSNITLVTTASSISVNENGAPIQVSNGYYPLAMPRDITLPVLTLSYDRLGRINTARDIVLTGTGSNTGVSANIRVETSGYAFAN